MFFYYFLTALLPFFFHFYSCNFEDYPILPVRHIKVLWKSVPPSSPFHSLQPLHRSHLALLQTSGICILHTEAIADLEVREMNRSLSRTFLHSTFHFKFNFCHLFHSLLSKKGDCIDTGHLCIWRRKKKDFLLLSQTTVQGSCTSGIRVKFGFGQKGI